MVKSTNKIYKTIHIKLKIEQHEPHGKCLGQVEHIRGHL
jgi:hypothetical protein